MKRILLLLFALSLFIFSCNRPSEKLKNTQDKPSHTDSTRPEYKISKAIKPKENTTPNFNYKNTSLKYNFSDSLFIPFSSDSTVDKFIFYVPQGNINKTESVLRIFNHSGTLIYKITFATRALINGYQIDVIKSEEEMEVYVLTKAKSILAKNNFKYLNNLTEQDGIINQASKEDYENYEVFVECKNEKRPLFCLGLEEESMTFLGYSKKLEKTVNVLYCC